MIITGLFFTILLGLLVVRTLGRFNWIETVGFSFLVGLGIQTMLMVVIDMFGLRITRTSVLLATGVLIAALCAFDLLRKKERRMAFERTPFQWMQVSWVAWIFIALIVWFEYMNLSKCLYFPTFDRDSLAAFDTIGWIISKEHTLRGLSIFQGDYMPGIHNAGSTITYSPMVQLSYAYVYLLSAESSKLIPGLVFLFFLIAFFATVQRVAGTTAAAIITFFTLITPEFIAFSSHSMTNVIHAVYASLGVIYLALWFRERKQRDFILAMLLLGINGWCRSEGIVFIGGAMVALFIDACRRKQYKPFLAGSAIALFPIVYWAVFMKVFGLYSENVVVTHPFWDPEKARTIWLFMKGHYSNLRFYGYSFLLFAAVAVVSFFGRFRRQDSYYLLLLILLPAIFYAFIIYQIDYKWDRVENVLAHSAKRFLFCFIPMVWFYVASSSIVSSGMKRLDGYLSEPLSGRGK